MPDHARHRVAADTCITRDGAILLIKRGIAPFKGQWCLPGGHVEQGEQVHEAAAREAREETGIAVDLIDLVGVYDTPGRDPRGPVIGIAYHARPADDATPSAATDAAEARWWPLDDLPDTLGFDHRDIVEDLKAGHETG